MSSGCEPSFGDICCIDEDDQEDELPEHFIRLLKIEDSGLTIRPKELEQLVIDLSVNKKESEMRQAEKEYIRLTYSKGANREESWGETHRQANFDFGVRPSGRAVLTKGDTDKVEPEIF